MQEDAVPGCGCTLKLPTPLPFILLPVCVHKLLGRAELHAPSTEVTAYDGPSP